MTCRWPQLGVSLLALSACADAAPGGHGKAWPEANGLFHRDARMIGADGAYGIDLGDDRYLWLFGDTFVARNHADPHNGSAFIRNSVALQTGRDPRTAWMRHYWRHDGDEVGSFFAEPAQGIWLWPMHGIAIDDTLVVFFERLHNEGEPGPWSFVADGWDARVATNIGGEPDTWNVTNAILPANGGTGMVIGEAVVRDGDDVLAFATRGDAHAVSLARFRVADLVAGDLAHPELWCGDEFARDCAATNLFSPGAPEFSVHFDAARARWVWVASGGFGAAPIVWRTAASAAGPWSEPTTLMRPPEAFRDGAFVYAGKAHPALWAGDPNALAVTYVPSGFDDFPHALDGIYYFPFFGRVWLE